MGEDIIELDLKKKTKQKITSYVLTNLIIIVLSINLFNLPYYYYAMGFKAFIIYIPSAILLIILLIICVKYLVEAENELVGILKSSF